MIDHHGPYCESTMIEGDNVIACSQLKYHEGKHHWGRMIGKVNDLNQLGILIRPPMYFIMNRYIGDSFLFWREGGHGYTTNPDEAWKLTKEEADKICRSRPNEDKPIRVDLAEKAIVKHVNSQIYYRLLREETENETK